MMKYLRAILLATAITTAACGGSDSTKPAEPGSFHLRLTGGASASLVVLTIHGPALPTAITPLGGYQVAWSGTGTTATVVVYGDGVIGDVARVEVPKRSQIPSYEFAIQEIASNSQPYAQLSPGDLSVGQAP